MAPSRRRVLELAGAGLATGLAGCTRAGEPGIPPTVTPAPVPSDRTLTAATPTPGQPPSPGELEFRVEVRDSFAEAHPARLEISLRNAGDRLLTVLDGPEHAVPFVDDDYAGVDASGQPALLLVPDDAGLRIDPADAPPDRIEAFLPEAATDGCWRVPFDWPDARAGATAVLHAVPLSPDQRRQHGYGLYFIDDCSPGTYRFEQTVELAAGDPPFERDLHPARLGFDVVVAGSMAVGVEVDEPRIGRPDGDD